MSSCGKTRAQSCIEGRPVDMMGSSPGSRTTWGSRHYPASLGSMQRLKNAPRLCSFASGRLPKPLSVVADGVPPMTRAAAPSPLAERGQRPIRNAACNPPLPATPASLFCGRTADLSCCGGDARDGDAHDDAHDDGAANRPMPRLPSLPSRPQARKSYPLLIPNLPKRTHPADRIASSYTDSRAYLRCRRRTNPQLSRNSW